MQEEYANQSTTDNLTTLQLSVKAAVMNLHKSYPVKKKVLMVLTNN